MIGFKSSNHQALDCDILNILQQWKHAFWMSIEITWSPKFSNKKRGWSAIKTGDVTHINSGIPMIAYQTLRLDVCHERPRDGNGEKWRTIVSWRDIHQVKITTTTFTSLYFFRWFSVSSPIEVLDCPSSEHFAMIMILVKVETPLLKTEKLIAWHFLESLWTPSCGCPSLVYHDYIRLLQFGSSHFSRSCIWPLPCGSLWFFWSGCQSKPRLQTARLETSVDAAAKFWNYRAVSEMMLITDRFLVLIMLYGKLFFLCFVGIQSCTHGELGLWRL